ncbi:MAG TPA: hypothetical protein VI197_28395 [Polyangiaceae bacterium]
MSRSRQGSLRVGLVLGLGLLVGCNAPGTTAEAKKLDPKLEQYVLTRLPKTVEQETYLDFEGKVQLLGYDVSPKDVAPPGSKISLTLYWQRTGNLDEGWKLFTHLLDAQGRQIAQYDKSGPLREGASDNEQALGPSDWEIGKIYVDKLEFEVPRRLAQGDEKVPLRTGTVTVAVGVWKEAARLDVLGGNSDARRRGFVTSLSTGLSREALLPKKKDEQKGSDG